MQIRLISDVHVDFYDTSEPVIKNLNQHFKNVNPKNEILVVAGDVGVATENGQLVPKYVNMLKYFKSRWEKVIYVPGNHEFYYSKLSIQEINNMISNECEKLGIEYLNKETFKVDNYTFVGCALWSNVDSRHWNEMKHKYENLDYKDMIKMWKNHVEWLDRTLSRIDGKVIVVTHYLPTRKLIGGRFTNVKYKISNTAYFSNLEWLIKKYTNKIQYWFCGHSHVTKLVSIDKTLLYLNPLGNPLDEHETTVYGETLTIL